MKKILLILVIIGLMAASAVLAGCTSCVHNLKCLDESDYSGGGQIERTFPAPDFRAVHAARAVEVFITADSTPQIRIEAPEKLMPYVIAEEQNGTLQISIDKKVKRISNAAVKAYVPANGKIRSLRASSAAKIICRTALGAETFSIDASSAAQIEAAVNTEVCEIDASSAAKIKAAIKTGECTVDVSSAVLSGAANKCTAEISSAAKFSAPEFQVARYAIDASSGSDASVHCTEELRAEASSGSSIEYKGDCSTDLSRSSGGSIRQTR